MARQASSTTLTSNPAERPSHVDDDEAGVYFFGSRRISTRVRNAAV